MSVIKTDHKHSLILLFLLISTCTAGIGYSYKTNHHILKQLSVMSALQYLGVGADPALQAKIGDLSRQIEDLQKMVTMLIPQQQQRIEQLQQKQQEQNKLLLQKQQEQEAREAEQREAEKKRMEEEARRLEEEKAKEEERQRALELEKIKQLELQKKQLELELKLKQEEEKRKHWREEARKRDEEQAEREAAEEEQKLKEQETLEKEEEEENLTCEAEEGCDEGGSDGVVVSQDVLDGIKVQLEEIIEELKTEKERLTDEVNNWNNFKETERAITKTQAEETRLYLKEVLDMNTIISEGQEALKALSEDLLEKFKNLEEENSVLKSKVGELETLINSKIADITTELGLLKEKIEAASPPPSADSTTNLDQVQDLITQSLKRYSADEVAMPDYALESSGAVVFTIGETEPYTQDTPWMGVFGISIWRSCKTPRLAIQKDNSPGNCWSFTGNKGTLTVQLSAQVFPEYFTIDHIPLELAPNNNASSAPNHFRVLGLDYGNAPKGHVLGNYEFTEFPIQTFQVQQNPYEKYFRFIKVEILSNYGNKDYTCLYRFRVHGRPYDTDTYNG